MSRYALASGLWIHREPDASAFRLIRQSHLKSVPLGVSPRWPRIIESTNDLAGSFVMKQFGVVFLVAEFDQVSVVRPDVRVVTGAGQWGDAVHGSRGDSVFRAGHAR